MKRQNLKARLKKALHAWGRPIAVALIVIGLGFSLMIKRPAHALSDRGKKVVGVLVGGGSAGGIAAIAGSAKWFPLGFGVGGLAGGLIARQVIKEHRKRKAREPRYTSERRHRRSEKQNNGNRSRRHRSSNRNN